MDLDVKDKKLLYEIDLNARIGTSLLGKKIRLSQEGTFYRLKRLEENNIIKGYTTLINFAKLGYTGYGVYARFQNITKNKKQEIISQLKSNNNVYWIAEFGGRFDIAFAIIAKNIIQFEEVFSGITNKYNKFLKDFTIAIRIQLTQYPREYLLENKQNKNQTPSFGKHIESIKLDALDESILKTISNNARISILELSKKINKPVSTTSLRLKQLERKEIIQGYSSKINCQEFGYQSYQLFIKTKNINSENKKLFLSYCQSHPNIIFCIEAIGEWNFEIIYELKNQKELQELIIELRTKFSNIVTNVESIVLFDHYVKYNQYPLE